MNLEKYQSEDFESTNENKYIKNQLHEFDFMQTFPIWIKKTEYDNTITFDYSKDLEVKSIGCIYAFDCQNAPLKKYYIRFFDEDNGISVNESKFNKLLNTVKSYYYQTN